MAKVDCIEIPGLYCWFWSYDHDPPHFHVRRRGEWEIKVKFTECRDNMFEQEWGSSPGARMLRRLREAVEVHRDALLKEWEAKVTQ